MGGIIMSLLSLFAMSTFLLTLLGLTVGNSYNCVMRKDISPCTCTMGPDSAVVTVTCERMTSYDQVVDALVDRFQPEQEISLKIAYSELDDLNNRSFSELGFTVTKLKLNYDNLSNLNASVFDGLERVGYFSLADNFLPEVFTELGSLKNMPLLKTLDFGRIGLQELNEDALQNLPKLQSLILAGNAITQMDTASIPHMLRHLHLGRNKLTDLNGTLRDLSELEWLFLNGNQLSSLDNQLPVKSHKMFHFNMAYNQLEKLPADFGNFLLVEHVDFHHNKLRSLNGALQKARRLRRLLLSHNNIQQLAEDEFLELERLEDLQLGHNQISSINNSLLPLRSLRCFNITHNLLPDFSLQEIRGLKNLRVIDLSSNRISHLVGQTEQNLVELETRVVELKLEHNLLRSLDGSLMGLHGLERLNLSHNQLDHISPDDLIGLDQLRVLDVSFNQLTTLEETSKTFLPLLEALLASNNALTILERDFYGLPVLCWADVSHNQIRVVGRELADKTRCQIHGVSGILHVMLHGNPVLCDEMHNETVTAMENSFAQLHGSMQCDSVNVTEILILE